MGWLAAAWALLSSKIGRYVAGAAAIALTVGVVLLKAFSAGRVSERARQQRANLRAYKERSYVDEEVRRRNADDIRRGLRDDWPE